MDKIDYPSLCATFERAQYIQPGLGGAVGRGRSTTYSPITPGAQVEQQIGTNGRMGEAADGPIDRSSRDRMKVGKRGRRPPRRGQGRSHLWLNPLRVQIGWLSYYSDDFRPGHADRYVLRASDVVLWESGVRAVWSRRLRRRLLQCSSRSLVTWPSRQHATQLVVPAGIEPATFRV